jgi:hypothetical protein
MKKLISAFFLVVACCLCLFLFPQIALSQKASTKDSLTIGASIFKKVSTSVVLVRGISNNSQMQGSGVAYAYLYKEGKPATTLVVTNAHVITDSNSIQVEVFGKTFPALILYTDPEIDIALLVVMDLVIPITKVTGADIVNVGDRVFAIGSPFGLKNSITEGIVSAIRDLNGIKYIQTSAAISKGSSGGGLFDRNGRFVGITTFKIISGESLNFAIDAQYINIVSKAQNAAGYVGRGKYENLITSEFIKWLLKRSSPNGDPMYLYVNRIWGEYLKTNNENLLKKLDEVAQQYGSELEPPWVQKSKIPVYRLACSMYSARDGSFQHEEILTIDEANSLVDGRYAQFGESFILFYNDKFKNRLDRYTSTLTIGTEKFPVLETGKCEKVGERKF